MKGIYSLRKYSQRSPFLSRSAQGTQRMCHLKKRNKECGDGCVTYKIHHDSVFWCAMVLPLGKSEAETLVLRQY